MNDKMMEYKRGGNCLIVFKLTNCYIVKLF